MEAKILSLNSGTPATMTWNGKSVVSSMLRHPIKGPLIVHRNYIEENSFKADHIHGLSDAVLYVYGLTSALEFVTKLGRSTFDPGSVGENVTLDHFDEKQISVGDIFQFGEVLAQATYPRIPCTKVNYRMQHEDGQKAMQSCGRSGVYFRILKPGQIHFDDKVIRIETSKHPFYIFDLYKKMISGSKMNEQETQTAKANGAFPEGFIEHWTE